MPNYRFQIINDVFEHHDDVGISLADLPAAKLFAINMLRDVMRAEAAQGIIDDTVRVRIERRRGEVVATMDADDIRWLDAMALG